MNSSDVVPTPSPPTKLDVAVVVDIKFPIVSCDPVAIKLPAELVVIIEFGENVVAENICDANVDVDTVDTRPFDPMNEYPCPSDDKNKLDPNVDDAVENRPLVKPIVVEVEL